MSDEQPIERACMPNDLSCVPTTELIDELMQRCAPAIFVGTRQEDGGVPFTFWHYSGNEAKCYGLCHEMSYYINRSMVYTEAKEAIEDE